MNFQAKSTFDKVFEAGILLKAADGLLEIIGGILLLVINPGTINHLVASLTQGELSEDPHDLVAHYLTHAVSHLGHGALVFGAIYLLSHGAVKVVLVAEILRGRLWAYPGLIVVTAGFMVYQIYRIGYSHSIGLILLTLFDGVVVYLTAKEYQKRRITAGSPASE